MARLGLETHLIDPGVYRRTLAGFREAEVLLPTFGELKDPSPIPAPSAEDGAATSTRTRPTLNLFRVHWYNDATRRGGPRGPGYRASRPS